MPEHILKYDAKKWEEILPKPVNTLQLFITNKCNLRCKACFYNHKLGKEEMPFNKYKQYVLKHAPNIKKVILLGGEPTMHKNLPDMIKFNQKLGLKTTIYTNGFNLKNLKNTDLSKTKLRIGVHGTFSSEKPLIKVPPTKLPVTIVYMLRKNNISELMRAARIAETKFNCKTFYISSIRDITATKNYWKDTKETIPLKKYFGIVQDFVQKYDGNLEIHLAKRGIIKTGKALKVNKCRFGNIFPDGEMITCPLDISKKITTTSLQFNKRHCNKNRECLLTKIVLRRKS